jgi:hypothetical protein
MLQSQVPPKFPIPWGNSAGSAYIRSIPSSSQIGVQNGAASLTDGFPPLTFIDETAGGVPPFGADFNGILKQVSQWCQWQSAGGPVFYDGTFSANIGGYPNGAMLQSSVVPGFIWLSIVDSNTTDPDTGGANWVQLPGQIQTGTPVQSLISTVPYGYVAANALTVGNPSSNATNRANSDTQFLFNFLWALPASVCPIYTSSGTASTRGASAAADYAANKAIAVPNMKGLGLMGVDTMGGAATTFLSGVPVTSGSDTVPGSIVGENLHSLQNAENATHSHSITDEQHDHSAVIPQGTQVNAGTTVSMLQGSQVNGAGVDITTASSFTGITGTNAQGSGTGHNTVERNMLVYWNLKL